MTTIWIITLLAVSATWSRVTGHNTTSRSYSTSPSSPMLQVEERFTVSRSEHFHLGRNVTLQCSNKTWSEMIYTIWNINLGSKKCHISSSEDNQHQNDCNDGKLLANEASGVSVLHIPMFSRKDEGVYKCETAHRGGNYVANINVSLVAPPMVSARLEREGSRQVAVCSAEGGKPAASIVWRNALNSSSAVVQIERTTNGSYSVKSRLVLEECIAISNLSCVVTHPFWTVEQTEKLPDCPKVGVLPLVLISVVTVSVVIVVLGGVYTLWNLSAIRNYFVSSTVPAETKFPPVEMVEEVEPYASYVQRNNSIYNSHADLFT